MPPPVTGETQPAASPIRSTPGAAMRFSGPPQGMSAAPPAASPSAGSSRSGFSVRAMKRGEVGLAAVADREAELDGVRARRGPGDVAGRQARIDEAVEEARIDGVVRLKFDLERR